MQTMVINGAALDGAVIALLFLSLFLGGCALAFIGLFLCSRSFRQQFRENK